MADAEHLAILNEGVKAWNQWRAEKPAVKPDLTRADLPYKTLNGADLSGANLWGADLVRTTLVGAHLRGADLSGADFTEGDLRKADLSGAQLYRACLLKANLHRTNLAGADVRSMNASQASFLETILVNLNLSNVIGLDSCEHFGPSTLDHRTITMSRNVPLSFLRGCGLNDSQIEASLMSGGLSSELFVELKFASCFISYSTKDQKFADQLHADLQSEGVRCWFAPQDMQAGRKLHQQIDEAIRLHDRLLVILSEHSMESEWVKTEIAHARQKEMSERRRVLFPISLVPFEKIRDWKNFDADTGKDSAREIREYFIPDFSNWKDHDSYQAAFQRLVRDLKAEEKSPGR